MAFVLEFWHWYALALIFIVIEALIPSGTFAALTIAGSVTGTAFLFYPELGWRPQLGIFAASTIIPLVIIKMVFADKIAENSKHLDETDAMIGKEFSITFPIQNGFGDVMLEDVGWALKGPDCKRGTKVRVIGTDGHVLSVIPVPKSVIAADDEKASNEKINEEAILK